MRSLVWSRVNSYSLVGRKKSKPFPQYILVGRAQTIDLHVRPALTGPRLYITSDKDIEFLKQHAELHFLTGVRHDKETT